MVEGKLSSECYLSDDELKHFEKILIKEQIKRLNQLGYLRDITGKTEIEQNGSNLYADFADQGTDAMEREKAFLFQHRDDQHLQRINAALERIKNRTFGICVVTGKFIGMERLEAVPTTTKCIEAKKQTKNLQPY